MLALSIAKSAHAPLSLPLLVEIILVLVHYQSTAFALYLICYFHTCFRFVFQ